MACGRAGMLGGSAGIPVLAALFWLGPGQGRAADFEQMKNGTVRIICSANRLELQRLRVRDRYECADLCRHRAACG